MTDVDLRRPDVLTLRVDDLAAATREWSERLRVPIKLRAERYVELQTETLLIVLTDLAERPGVALGWEVQDLDRVRLPPDVSLESAVQEPSEGFGARRGIVMDGGIALELISWSR